MQHININDNIFFRKICLSNKRYDQLKCALLVGNLGMEIKMHPVFSSLINRIIGLFLQAAILFILRSNHAPEDQALFFAVQTVLALQFLAEFGAGPTMLQRMRKERYDNDEAQSEKYFSVYAVISSLLFTIIIYIAWENFYGTNLILSPTSLLLVALVGALRLSTVFLEVYVEGKTLVMFK